MVAVSVLHASAPSHTRNLTAYWPGVEYVNVRVKLVPAAGVGDTVWKPAPAPASTDTTAGVGPSGSV